MKISIKSLFVSGTDKMVSAFQEKGVSFRVDPTELEDNFPQTLPKNAGRIYPNAENLIVNKAPVTITKHNPKPETIATAIAGGETCAEILIKPHAQGKGVNVHINRKPGKPSHSLTKNPEAEAQETNSFQIGGSCTRWTFLPKK